MEATELILSVLGNSPEPIDGRTAIQKISYFSSLRVGVDMGYRPHFYGPYSPVLASLLENLVGLGFVEEKPRLTLRGRTMYSYSLTDDGYKLLDEIRKREPSEFAAVRRVVDRSKKIAGNSINVLSWAAKANFLLSQKGQEISYEEVKEAGKRFGWKLSDEEIGSGVKLLAGLGLARKS